MKYWLPIWLTTLLFALQGTFGIDDSQSRLTNGAQDAGAKLIGGLAPEGEEPPEIIDGEQP